MGKCSIDQCTLGIEEVGRVGHAGIVLLVTRPCSLSLRHLINYKTLITCSEVKRTTVCTTVLAWQSRI